MHNEIWSLYLACFRVDRPHRKNASLLFSLMLSVYLSFASMCRFGVALSQKWQIIQRLEWQTHEKKKEGSTPIKITSVNAGAINAWLCNFQVNVCCWAEARISVFGMSSRFFYLWEVKKIPKHLASFDFDQTACTTLKKIGWSIHFLWNLRIGKYEVLCSG